MSLLLNLRKVSQTFFMSKFSLHQETVTQSYSKESYSPVNSLEF